MRFAGAVQVERGLELGVGAGEIQVHRVALDRHRDLQSHRDLARHIVVEVVVKAIRPRRDSADQRPRLRLAVVEAVVNGREEIPAAVALDQLVHAALADPERGDHCAQVAPVIGRHAHIVEDELDHVLVQIVLLVQLDRRDADAFLEHLIVGWGEAARHVAADVGGVHVGEGEAHQLAVMEHRAEYVDVGQVR